MAINKVVINQSLYGQLVQNRIYVDSESFQEVEEVADHIQNSWIGRMRNLQHNLLRYTSIVVTRVDDAGSAQFTKVIDITGAQAGESQQASFIAGVVQFKTSKFGPQFRGRYYAAAIRMGGTQFGQFQPNEFTNWQNELAILQQNYCGPDGGTTGLRLVIRGEKVVHNTTVTNIGMRPILGVVRTRNIGVGA